jgi:8-oxo-dGTP pyrophosphatase MutT (NUDIX family)
MPVAELRPASTVVLIRPSPAPPFEILLVRRNDRVAFMAGAYVFPGGRVDDEDRAHAEQLPQPAGASRFHGLTPRADLAYRVAGVREMQEEASVSLDVDDLIPFAHWVTPEIEIRRYDTRFFLDRMPEGQIARHDEGEMTALAWLTPNDAIARCRAGDIMLPPPTWTTLKQLSRCASIEAAIAWASTKPIVCVQPGFIKDEVRAMLTLPGDPLHPTIPGWEIPEDTRFVLEEGKRWMPVRA